MIVAEVIGNALRSKSSPFSIFLSSSLSCLLSLKVCISKMGALIPVATLGDSSSDKVWDEITRRVTKVKIRPVVSSNVELPADCMFELQVKSGFYVRADH